MNLGDVYDHVVGGGDLSLLDHVVDAHVDPASGVLTLTATPKRKAVRDIRFSAVVDDPTVRLARVDVDASGRWLQVEIHPL